MKELKFSTSYGNYEVYFRFTNYATGVTAVEALESAGGTYARASVNMEHAPILPNGQFYLKDWGGNVEIAKAMIDEKLIEPVKGTAAAYSGYNVVAHVYQFTEYGLNYVENAREYFENARASAQQKIKDLNDLLTDEERTLHLVRNMLESHLPANDYYPPNLPDYFREALEHLAIKAKQEWLTNLYCVFQHAESPIEKIFVTNQEDEKRRVIGFGE